jgi:hypothetical protein
MPVAVFPVEPEELSGEQVYHSNQRRSILVTDSRIKFGNLVYPIWSVQSVQTELIDSPHSPLGCLPMAVGLGVFFLLSGGLVSAFEGHPGGFFVLGLGLIASLICLKRFADHVVSSKPAKAMRVTIRTSSGEQCFWSEDHDEVQAVAQAINESIANFKKH